MLGEVRLERLDAVSSPLLERPVAQVGFDLMQRAAQVHALIIGCGPDGRLSRSAQLTWLDGLGRLNGLVQDGIGEPRPGLLRPVAEGAIGEYPERQLRDRIDPEEGAAAAKMPECAGRIA